MNNSNLDRIILREIKNILFETPLGDVEYHGNFEKPSSFKKRDLKIVTSKPYVKQLKNFYKKTPYDFKFYLVNHPKLNKEEFKERGRIDRRPDVMNYLEKEVGLKISEPNDEIIIIFNGNFGSEQIFMSPWITAHRIGHALWAGGQRHHVWDNDIVPLFGEFVQKSAEFYGVKVSSRDFINQTINPKDKNFILGLFSKIFTFKSARENKVTRPFEYVHETLAQYLNLDEVRTNPYPEYFKRWRFSYYIQDKSKMDEYEEYKDIFTRTLEHYWDALLGANINSIFLM